MSKNNFNYKRIGLILSILPQSIFLLPFRDPIQHSKSLLMQHEHFLKLQNKNSFIKRYMNYLGHKEFGLLHKSWNEPIKYKNISHINYWLEQWYLFYSNLFSKFKENNNCYFVKYESLNSFGSNENISVKFDVKFNYIERHFTLDRTWKGTDHAASLEPDGMRKLVRDIRNVSQALNYKTSEILDIEWPSRQKLKMLTKNSHNNGYVAASIIKYKNSNRPKIF